ncbi:hypothetical protein FACS1894110_25180 [Spirochaetia bacterium]|nr:hypothetical protein FACS1894110_25180 [Spirochaetia bacterium]
MNEDQEIRAKALEEAVKAVALYSDPQRQELLDKATLSNFSVAGVALLTAKKFEHYLKTGDLPEVPIA